MPFVLIVILGFLCDSSHAAEPTAPSAPAAVNSDETFRQSLKSHRLLVEEVGRAQGAVAAGSLDKSAAIKEWQDRFIPENRKNIDRLRPALHVKYVSEQHVAFAKALDAYDALLKAGVSSIKEGPNEANKAAQQQSLLAYSNAFKEMENESAKDAAFLQNLSAKLNNAKERAKGSKEASSPTAVAAKEAAAKSGFRASAEDIDNLLPPPAPPSPEKPSVSARPPATSPKSAAAPSGSAAAGCRASLGRYPRVSPAMMTMCRQANAHSAKVMDVYTSIYRGGMSKKLMDEILAIDTEEQATCATQIAQKFRRSMTAKYLRETCL